MMPSLAATCVCINNMRLNHHTAGPINSWDRMPFLTRIASGGGAASYSLAPTDTAHNAIIANYGASQGFDNDDGSSA